MMAALRMPTAPKDQGAQSLEAFRAAVQAIMAPNESPLSTEILLERLEGWRQIVREPRETIGTEPLLQRTIERKEARIAELEGRVRELTAERDGLMTGGQVRALAERCAKLVQVVKMQAELLQ
jgi:hypothetical protein